MTDISQLTLPRLKVNAGSMEKVDRLGWAAGFSLQSYGVRIGIRSNEQAALERVREHLPHAWEILSSPEVDRVYSILIRGADSRSRARRFSLLYSDDIKLSRFSDLDHLFSVFESDLRIFVAEYATRRIFVHAGVVGWKGRAIVIPGRSYSGKSSLVAELVKAGATYYSDEYAVLDSQGRVHPYLKPLELREEGAHDQTKFDVSELGGHAGTKPLPVGLVVMTEFKKGASWRPRKLTAGKGVLAMLANTVPARRSPERALAALQRVALKADVLKGVRGEARDALPAILKRLEKSSNNHR